MPSKGRQVALAGSHQATKRRKGRKLNSRSQARFFLSWFLCLFTADFYATFRFRPQIQATRMEMA
jgi:hypothetical protein